MSGRHRATPSPNPDLLTRSDRPRGALALLATAAALIVTAGLTLSPSGTGATPTTTETVTVARDGFSRTVSAGLGQADVGGAWTTTAPHGSVVNVAGHGATLSALAPGAGTTALLRSVAAADTDVVSTVVLPNLASSKYRLYHTLRARTQPDGSAYGGRVTVREGGTMSVSIMKYVGRTESSLGSIAIPGTVAANQPLTVEFSVSGKAPVTLAVRAWTTGSAPKWQYTTTDSSPSALTGAGGVGFADYVSTASRAITLRVMSILATTTRVISGTSSSSAPSSSSTSSAPSSSSTSSSSSSSSSSTTTSSSSSSTPPPPADTSDRGSVPVGAADYPAPSNAIFVSSRDGDDAAAGTESDPLRTVARAIAIDTTGRTIVLRGGTYHESVQVYNRPGVTIQAYPREAVWFDGSRSVGGWTQHGRTWVATGWTAQFDHGASFTRGSDAGGFVNPAYPMAPYPDQVFVDGKQLRQVATAGDVTAGTFAVDYAAQTITIGSDPDGHAVRATDLARAIVIGSAKVTLRGFGVRNYANSLPTGPAVYFGASPDGVAQNLVFTDIATQALGVSRCNARFDHVTALRIGMLSITGTQADGSVLENSVVHDSNWENFNASPSAAGVKITRSRGITVRNNDLSTQNGVGGLWLDESVVGFTIVNNTITDSGPRSNIQIELSDTGIVANNVLTGGDKGLFIFDSANVRVFNNQFGNNSRGSVFMMQDQRRESTPGNNHDPRQPVPDPTCTWVIHNITVSNNSFDFNGGQYGFQFYVLDSHTNIPASAMNIVIDGNMFHAAAAHTDTMVGWGQGDNKSLSKYQTPAELNAGVKKEWTNGQSGGAVARQAVSSVAVPLPADIAAAIGQPTGVRHLGTF